MRLPGRVAAAIEVLEAVLTRHQPASEALRDWGKSHRFAGSGDRHAIGTLVYDALRHKNSAAFRSGSDQPRGLVLGTLRSVWNMSVDDIAAIVNEQHGPGALTSAESSQLNSEQVSTLPHIAGDFPEWLAPSLTRVFAEKLVAEMQALADRAPIDLRVNTLKATREQVLKALARFYPVEGPLSPWALRIAAPPHDSRHISVEAEPAHGLGWFEVQDAASQMAALLSNVTPGETVADICAGAGGKSLALAAMLNNTGKLVAHDVDRRRLRPIFERITRAGVNCADVLAAEDGSNLEHLGGFDCVFIDAPCTGTGSWRRKPDAKWKLKPATLEQRQKDQRDVLKRGAALLKPGGRLVYATCSVLSEENTDQVNNFLSANPLLKLIPYTEQWRAVSTAAPPASADGRTDTLLMTPFSHGTDGFFVAVMVKSPT